jgi:16S rRNA (uracil1498-N3)-methyltransferase
MHRFFVPPSWLEGERLSLTGPLAHQLGRVLRMRPGDHIVLLDNSGWAVEVELDQLTPQSVQAHPVHRWQPQTEPRTRLCLYQALTSEKKLDWVLQKGTELGAACFTPTITRRSLLQGDVSENKLERWRRILTEAAEQSGRARIPELTPPMSLEQALSQAADGHLSLIATVEPTARPLRAVLESQAAAPQQVDLFIGPEGGFEPAEIELARQQGVQPISLGPRILRTETAGIVALAAISYALGEMGQ